MCRMKRLEQVGSHSLNFARWSIPRLVSAAVTSREWIESTRREIGSRVLPATAVPEERESSLNFEDRAIRRAYSGRRCVT